MADQFREVPIHELGMHSPRHHVRMTQESLEEADVRRDAIDPEIAQGSGRPPQGAREIGSRRAPDDLRQQGVEVRVGAVAGVPVRVHPHAGSRWRLEGAQAPAGWRGAPVGPDRLQVHAGLHREPSGRRNVSWRRADLAQALPASQPELQLHEIDPSRFLGDGMFDLQARVGFDEREAALLDQKLEGAQATISGGFRQGDGRSRQVAARPVREPRGRRDLDQLLEPALQRAITIADLANSPRVVGGDLDLDMARVRQQAFHKHVRDANGTLRFRTRPLVSLREFGGAADYPDPAAAAAGDSLDEHGCALRQGREEIPGLIDRYGFGSAHRDRDAKFLRQRPRPNLVPEQFQARRRRPDEAEAFLGASPREGGTLAQETVARMHGIAAALPGHGQQPLGVKIRADTRPRQLSLCISPADMQRIGIVLGIDRDGLDAEFARRQGDPHRDLAAVRNQQFHALAGSGRRGRLPMMPSRSRAASSASVKPSSPPSTCRLCWPRVGAGHAMPQGPPARR